MREVALDVVDLPGRRLLCSGTRKMDRASGNHVRQVELRMPAMQLDPVANHSETQIVVHAANVQTGQSSDEDFFCSYVVVGKLFDNK